MTRTTNQPAWLERTRFDIAAKAPQGTSPADVRLMLQDLLTDRFKLAAHRDTRPTNGFVLTLGKDKHKMKEALGPGAGCQGTPPPQPPPVPMTIGACRGVTMDQFAQLLRDIAGGYINAPAKPDGPINGGTRRSTASSRRRRRPSAAPGRTPTWTSTI